MSSGKEEISLPVDDTVNTSSTLITNSNSNVSNNGMDTITNKNSLECDKVSTNSSLGSESNFESDIDNGNSLNGDHHIEENVSQDHLFAHLRLTRRNYEDLELPTTASILENNDGGKLYLIGTAHFSKESCEDVQKVISMVQPDAVVVELCSSRTQILTLDDMELARISDENGYSQLKRCIQQKGFLSGLVLYTMLYMSAHITKQLGMPPGSEFRAAFHEVKQVPGCRLYLGDRPISITLQRMMASLSFWEKLRFGFMLLQELKPISAEDVEKLKQQDMFEQLMEEMINEFPHMTNVLVSERDTFITGYLQRVMNTPVILPGQVEKPPVVVGVFGIGHCNGIKNNFPNKISPERMAEIQKLPPPSKSRKILKITVKGALFVVSAYTAYKLTKWLGVYPDISRWT